MSFQAAAWAISNTQVTTIYQKMVLIVLADCHNAETGRCDPSIDFISNRCLCSRSKVIRVLKELEDGGILTRERRNRTNGKNQSNAYSLLIPSVPQTLLPVSHSHLGSVPGTPVVVSPGHPNQEVNQERTSLAKEWTFGRRRGETAGQYGERQMREFLADE